MHFKHKLQISTLSGVVNWHFFCISVHCEQWAQKYAHFWTKKTTNARSLNTFFTIVLFSLRSICISNLVWRLSCAQIFMLIKYRIFCRRLMAIPLLALHFIFRLFVCLRKNDMSIIISIRINVLVFILFYSISFRFWFHYLVYSQIIFAQFFFCFIKAAKMDIFRLIDLCSTIFGCLCFFIRFFLVFTHYEYQTF